MSPKKDVSPDPEVRTIARCVDLLKDAGIEPATLALELAAEILEIGSVDVAAGWRIHLLLKNRFTAEEA